jgi:hypothetical protein
MSATNSNPHLEALAAALADGLTSDLLDPDKRTAALQEVARKVLQDNDWSYARQQLEPVRSIVDGLPTTPEEDDIPPLTGS